MLKIIQSPIYNAQEQFSAMKSVLEILNTSEILTNFVGVLCQNRRLFVLPDMIISFRELLDNLKGKMTATVIASSELDKNQINTINDVKIHRALKKIKNIFNFIIILLFL